MNNDPRKEPKTIPPPYLSVAKLEKTVELISSRNFSDVSASLFRNYGFGNADALLAVSALRFLGIVDKNGKPTDLMAKLRLQGDAKKKEFEKIVRVAYGKLFDAVETPQNLPSDELANEFYLHYKLSPRLVKSAIPAFIKLCEYAGLKAEGSVVARKRRPSGAKTAKVRTIGAPPRSLKELDDVAVCAGFRPVRVAEGRMVLNIPAGLLDKLLDDDSLSEDWKMLRTALRTFADKHIPDELPKSETPD